MREPRVEVLCIGTELLSGKVNTHASWLATTLRGIGLSISRETTLPDSVGAIRDATAQAVGRSEVVLACGGLGPTFDDVTREGVAEALGRPLQYRPKIYSKIQTKLRRYYRGRPVPEENRRQAFVIEGAKALDNPHGSAPGQWLRVGGKTVVLLPGPPWELQPMFLLLLPALKAAYAPKTCACKTVFRLCGIAESEADERLQPLIRRPEPGIDLTILANHGLVDFHVAARGASKQQADRLMARARRNVERLVGNYLFGTDDDTLESVVGDRLRRLRLTLATAESCTGGLLSGQITGAAGSSDYYAGGIVAYANAVKLAQLYVNPRTLRRDGAVSDACAREMAEGAMLRLDADCGVSVTGVAGPGGGTAAKPVGLVFIGLAREGRPTKAHRHLFSGTRQQIRERSVIAALTWLYRSLAR